MKMFLDDIRVPQNDYDVIVRSFDEAVKFVQTYGIPTFISFDHDLGCDEIGNILKSGYDFAKYLVDIDIENIPESPLFKIKVFSEANPKGDNLIDVSYGISQILPIVTQLFSKKITIEEALERRKAIFL